MSRARWYRRLWVHALLAIVAVYPSGEGVASYPRNYLSEELGASVFTEAKLTGPFEPNSLRSDGPVSKGRFAFAPIEQRRSFTVDLGQVRTFDRIQIGTAGNPSTVSVGISSQGPDGPFRQICEVPGPVFLQVIRLPLSSTRWLRFDLGRGAGRIGVHWVRIYKGYEHPGLAEVTQLLCERTKPGLPGLEEFYTQVGAGQWAAACSALRAYFASAHKPDVPPDPDYDLERAKGVIAGELDYAGLSRVDPHPIDWSWMKTTDWYEHKNFLNRGSAAGVLADACYHTGDSLWADRFREVFYDWVDENPKPDVMSGADYPTWRTLDTAARSSWLISRFAEVTAAEYVDDELWANYLYSICEHADYLKNDDFSGGNWLATITSAVTHAAWEFPEFKDRKLWLEYGKAGFERNVLRDIHPDGKEMEDAPGYICMAYKAMLATLESLNEEGIEVDGEVLRRLNKVQDFLAVVTQPNGIMPNIGDWGGCEPYALPRAMEHFDRDDIRYVLSQGRDGKPPKWSSVYFPQGGWSIMRSRYTGRPYEDARHLVFKSSSGAHGHRDVLSITAYAFGRELLIDPGIRSYERADVERYLQTSYHNTVCIDNSDQPRRTGNTDLWYHNQAVDCVSGVFSGYPNVLHRRTILFVRPDYWLVRDEISGSGAHTYDQNWHFAADADPVVDERTKRGHTGYDSEGNMLIIPLKPDAVECRSFDFFIAAKRMEGGKSDVPARGIRYSASGDPPVVFDTLLYPYQGSQPPSVFVKLVRPTSGPAGTIGLEITAGRKADYVLFSPDGLAKASFAGGRIEVEAKILAIRTLDDKPYSVGGSHVRRVVCFGETLYDENGRLSDVYFDLK